MVSNGSGDPDYSLGVSMDFAHPIATIALMIAVAGLAVSVFKLLARWNQLKKKERQEFERLVKERERSMTFEQMTEAKLRALEETGIYRASVRDVLAVSAANAKNDWSSGSGTRWLFPSGTIWDIVLVLSALLAVVAM